MRNEPELTDGAAYYGRETRGVTYIIPQADDKWNLQFERHQPKPWSKKARRGKGKSARRGEGARF